MEKRLLTPGDMRAFVGLYNLDETEDEEQNLDVEKIILHPHFSKRPNTICIYYVKVDNN